MVCAANIPPPAAYVSFARFLAQGGFPGGSVVKNPPAAQEMQEMRG